MIINDNNFTNVNQIVNENKITDIEIIGSNTNIQDAQFARCTTIKTVNLSGDIKSIGTYCFYNCYNLTSIILPDSLETIGNYCFSYCASLASINLPESLKNIGNYCFYSCYNLATINLPDSIRSIGNYCFYSCYNLATINLPDSLKTIGSYAFFNCISLENITFGSSLMEIGIAAFSLCQKLSIDTGNNPLFTFNDDFLIYNRTDLIWYNLSSTNTVIDLNGKYLTGIEEYLFALSNVKQINFATTNIIMLPKGMFYNCSDLTDVKLSDKITILYDECFANCNHLSSINLENVLALGPSCLSNTSLKSINISNAVQLSMYVFKSCVSLNQVEISSNLKSIGIGSFMDCTNINNLVLDGVSSIPAYCFFGCEKLTTVNINYVMTIGNYAFSKTNLKHINLPYVCRLDNNTFENCANLESISFTINIYSIGENVFKGCNNLTTINYCTGYIPNATAFNGLPANVVFIVPVDFEGDNIHGYKIQKDGSVCPRLSFEPPEPINTKSLSIGLICSSVILLAGWIGVIIWYFISGKFSQTTYVHDNETVVA